MPESMTIERMLEHERLVQRRRTTDSTQGNAERSIRLFAEAMGINYVEQITPALWMHFVRRTLHTHYPDTINKYLRMLKAALSRLVLYGLLEKNPLGPVRMLPIPERQVVILTPDQERRVLSWIPCPYVKAFMLTGLATGCRLSELLAMRWEDIDLKTRRVVVRTPTKGRRTRMVRLTRQAADALRKLPRERETDCPLVNPDYAEWITRLRLVLRKAAGRADVHGLTPHVLRKTCLTRLAAAGVLLHDLRDYAGHRNIMTTMRYYIAHDAERTIDAVARAQDGPSPTHEAAP